jgi:hypothetical protein
MAGSLSDLPSPPLKELLLPLKSSPPSLLQAQNHPADSSKLNIKISFFIFVPYL